MNLDKYDVLADKANERFSFFSKGPRGVIRKGVHIQRMGDTVYNLAFGDWDEENQCLNDNVRSGNGDGRKGLVTVASAALMFLEHHPGAIVFAKGNIPAKTRLYRMGVNYCFREINHLFEVKGLHNHVWESFQPEKTYDMFSIVAKENFKFERLKIKTWW